MTPETATKEHVAIYVRDLATRNSSRHAAELTASGAGLANATTQQRLTAGRLYYDYLIEEGRQDLMACAYLLTEFTALSAVGEFRRESFIERVFGIAPVQAAVDRVATELQRLGFGKCGRIQRVPAAMYEALLINRSPRLEDLNYELLNTLHQQIVATLKPEPDGRRFTCTPLLS